MDKDPDKIGTMVKDFLVVAPESVHRLDYDKIVVSVNGYFDEILQELSSLGVPESMVVPYTDYVRIYQRNTGTMKADWSRISTVDDIYDELCRHADEDSPLEREFLVGKHNRSFKWLHYFEIYNHHFSRFYGKPCTIMEIGINKGGSLQLWKKVFGAEATIIGVDVDPTCMCMEDEQIRVFIGDQESRDFWRKIKQEIPPLDILIDDGGHYMQQQIVTFQEMFPHVRNGGVYLCEDVSTSYDIKKYHAGYKKPHTFAEFSKNFIDWMHAWFDESGELKVDEYTRSIHSVHYYFGVVAVEKAEMHAPIDIEVCNTTEEKYAKCHPRGIL